MVSAALTRNRKFWYKEKSKQYKYADSWLIKGLAWIQLRQSDKIDSEQSAQPLDSYILSYAETITC
jgi:hypothetical protein